MHVPNTKRKAPWPKFWGLNVRRQHGMTEQSNVWWSNYGRWILGGLTTPSTYSGWGLILSLYMYAYRSTWRDQIKVSTGRSHPSKAHWSKLLETHNPTRYDITATKFVVVTKLREAKVLRGWSLQLCLWADAEGYFSILWRMLTFIWRRVNRLAI